ncbi:MAG TPA: serine/threonine-protein kinase [Polyangiaceae bacterium]
MGAANDAKETQRSSGVPPRIATRFQSGDVLADKYRVERVIGTGGMGVVVEARHLQLGQSVAIKLLSVEDSRRTEATARFLREARAAAGLQSDHVVRIYDMGALPDGYPFIVMELLRGVDLATLLETAGPLSIAESVEYLMQAADAIQEAHEHGVVHRDLKPANLFVLQRSDGSPLIKVLDFGISKALKPDESIPGNLTATRTIMGSPYYMSPEQVRDAKTVDGRSDIWQLGVILHELLTGEPVFKADTLPGICAAIAADAPVPLREYRPDAPPELEAVVLRCLEKDPARRFQTVQEFRAALTPFRRSMPASLQSSGRGVSTRLAGVQVRVPSGLSDAPTLAASQSQVIQFQGGASNRDGSISGERTLREAGAITAEPEKRARSGRTVLLIGVGVAALALGGVVLTRVRGSAPASAADPALAQPARPAAVAASSFVLYIESVPSGAEVYEGTHDLGRTPLSITIDKADVRARPRTLALRHAGYQPYTVVQGDSQENVRLLAALVAESPAPAVASSESAPAATRRSPARTRVPSPQQPPTTSPDIRMQR